MPRLFYLHGAASQESAITPVELIKSYSPTESAADLPHQLLSLKPTRRQAQSSPQKLRDRSCRFIITVFIFLPNGL